MPTSYGQVVIGPPGSGKTTYCNGMEQFLTSMNRKVAVVNLDPANENLPYKAVIDIADLVCLENVMEELNLGPNGGLVYCMKYLEENISWLLEKLREFEGHYFIFDLPGQVELYTHENCLHNILQELTKQDFRLCCVHLVDAHHCSDSSKFISVVLLSLSSMVRMELPHINILSKIDLIQQYGELEFNLDYYTDVLDLRYLLSTLDKTNFDMEQNATGESDAMKKGAAKRERFVRLNEKLIEVIEDFSLVNFHPMNISDAETVHRVVQAVDKCNGYSFGHLDHLPQEAKSSIWSAAASSTNVFHSQSTSDIQERYLSDRPLEDDISVVTGKTSGSL